jgi:hypothetical protein
MNFSNFSFKQAKRVIALFLLLTPGDVDYNMPSNFYNIAERWENLF